MKILRFLDNNLEKFICAILLSAMTVVIFLQIVLRLAGLQLAWTEESGRYMFIWMIYISSAMAVKVRAHIKVDVLKVAFGKKVSFWLDVLSNVMFFFFAVVFFYYSILTVNKLAFVRPQTSPTLHLPMWVVYFSIVAGFALMCVRLVQDTILLFRQKKSGAYYKEEENEIEEEVME